MSLAFADYDRDGHMDVFVTNDTMPNFLFHNRGDGTFEEVALAAGVALPDDGKAISSMGADLRDYHNDGLPDIALTALAGETFPLFRNLGKRGFRDVTFASRVGPLSARSSGWANAFGISITTAGKTCSPPTRMSPTISRASPGNGINKPTCSCSTAGMANSRAPATSFPPSAHTAFAAFNGDGRIDVAVSCLGERAELWENLAPAPNHWLIVRLRGRRSNRDGIGAEIRLAGQHNLQTTSFGYASSSYAGVHFGLGRLAVIPELEVRWPSGTLQRLGNVPSDQVLWIREP